VSTVSSDGIANLAPIVEDDGVDHVVWGR